MLTRQKVITAILLIFTIIVLVNIIAARFYFRLDFTADRRYTLSSATENILKNIEEPVTVKAYFSENLPPRIASVKKDFRDMLVEYNSLSGGNIVYEFLNPSETEQTEMEAQQAGVQPITITIREKDQAKQQRAYLGAVLQLGDRKEVLPVVQPGAAMEYELSTAIKKLSVIQKPKVGLLVGHGEPGLDALAELQQQLNILYEIDSLELTPGVPVPEEYKAVIVIAPQDTVPSYVFNTLDNYLAVGGGVFVALNTTKDALQEQRIAPMYTGYRGWLKSKGIIVKQNLVTDVNSASIMAQQQRGGFRINTPVQLPYLPFIRTFSDHPITKGLEEVVFQFVSEVSADPVDTTVTYTQLAATSERAGSETPPVFIDINRQWGTTDFTRSNVPVALAAEGKLAGAGTKNSKLVVIGDGDFAVNGTGQQQRRQQPDNINLASNSIDWIADDTGLIELRTKGVQSRPIDEGIDEGTKALYKYFNFIFPMLVIVIYGIMRYRINNNIRKKIMSVDYVQ